MNAIRKTLQMLAGVVALTICTPQTQASHILLPTVILDNVSAMVLYHSGRADAAPVIAYRLANPDTVSFTFREVMLINRSQAELFVRLSPHFAAFLLGRADAFEEASILYDPPTTG